MSLFRRGSSSVYAPPHEDGSSDGQYHLEVTPGDVASAVLLPGNPDRIDLLSDRWDTAETVATNREYRSVTGTTDGIPISACSTGIGSLSASIAVEELARVGAETFIRVGSCGAINRNIDVGDLVITTGAVRQEGTSDEYVREDYPAVANHEVVAALIAAAEHLGHEYHVGITMSADSFYTGQARERFGGFEAAGSEERLDELRRANVLNIEMETSAILTLANLFGLRGGAVCTVFANRETREFRSAGEARAAATATEAVKLLSRMEDRKEASEATHWHSRLSL